ncbi:MAG: hypothetical protein FWF00_05005 [Endomicrobia bacterium]|nr:hypothetical protein [Endomicrobiia bacterium]MCL2507026.1 hypothetical protein [Endomicrobiia bacterium]
MEKFTLSSGKKTVFIMGAGASKDDNIPVQNEILDRILKGKFAYAAKNPETAAGKEYLRISSSINKLILSIFGKYAPENLSLESLFNILETASEKRENIGKLRLKEVRAYYRDLIQGVMYATRTVSDAETHNVKKYLSRSADFIKSPYTELGVQIYKNYTSKEVNFSFINFNYDICLDRVLLSMHHDTDPKKSFDLDYGIDLGNYDLSTGHKFSFKKPRARKLFLLRPHGSVNWLFCRSCGQVFSKLTRQNRVVDIKQETECYSCKLTNLEPYIVYPSYNRIYENKHLLKIWMSMETLLAQADKWCFIGYSLPDADRYFSYILTKIYNFKKAQGAAPEISVVNINSPVKRQKTIIDLLKNCSAQKSPSEKAAEDYFTETIKDRDIFRRFGVYFNNVVKYECSFKEFTNKCLEVK